MAVDVILGFKDERHLALCKTRWARERDIFRCKGRLLCFKKSFGG
ncbi:hypothetical protein [Caldicoprobacter guelmensis]|nr:hypothetical protein [Caldicoprobacter guelmensis]